MIDENAMYLIVRSGANFAARIADGSKVRGELSSMGESDRGIDDPELWETSPDGVGYRWRAPLKDGCVEIIRITPIGRDKNAECQGFTNIKGIEHTNNVTLYLIDGFGTHLYLCRECAAVYNELHGIREVAP